MSKLLVSYENQAALGTVTASSEHPSFPVENIQHRWFKKTWRSKYGAGSSWGLFRITTANQNLYFAEAIAGADSGMEAWTTPTNLTSWTENLAGTCTINQEATIKHAGSYSARFDVDASNNDCYLTQTQTLVAGAPCQLTIWYRNAAGKTCGWYLRDSASNVYLKTDGTWDAAAQLNTLPDSNGAWASYTLTFNAHASYTSYRLALRRVSAASSSIYFDDCAVHPLLTATIPAGDYDATTLCAEIKTQMEAAGALTYTVTYDDATNKFTIAGSGSFYMLYSIQTNPIWNTIGFTATTNPGPAAASFTSSVIRIHTSEFLYIDFGSTETVRLVSIFGHNLTSSATITCRYYSDAFVTLVDSEVLTWHVKQIGIRTGKSYRYMAIEISDPANTDTFIEVGVAWAGDASQLHYGFGSERTKTPNDPSTISESEDGQASSIQLTRFDEWNYLFEAVEPNTDKAKLELIFETIGKSLPCFIVEAPPDSGDVGEDLMYVTFPEWEWTHIAGNYWSLALGVREER